MVQLPGYKRLRAFAKEFKKDFDCLQPQTRQHQYSIYLASLKDNHDQLEGRPPNVESSLTLTSTASISNPAINPQPLIEVLAQESPASVIAASSNSITSSVTLISQAVVDSCTATVGGATLAVPAPYPSLPDNEEETESDTSGTEYDDSKSDSEETVDAEHGVGDDDRPQHMTFHNCQHVYVAVNAYNAHDVQVENAGNNTPQVTYNSSPSSASSSASSCHDEFCHCHLPRYEEPSDFTRRYELPPMLPPLSFQESMDSLLSPPGILPVGNPGPDSDQCTVVLPARQASMSARDTSLMQESYADDANSSQHSPKMPGSNIFKLPRPDSKFPPFTINSSDHLNHMGHFLPPFPGATIQNSLANNSKSSPLADPDSILEQQLELVLKAVQKSRQSGTFSPRAQDSLKRINSLVSTETLVTSARTTSTCQSSDSISSCDSAQSRPHSGYC